MAQTVPLNQYKIGSFPICDVFNETAVAEFPELENYMTSKSFSSKNIDDNPGEEINSNSTKINRSVVKHKIL